VNDACRPADRAERALLAATMLLALAHASSTLLRAPGQYLPWADFGAYCAAFAGSVLLAGLRAVREPGQRAAWVAVSVALLLWTLGAVHHGVRTLTGAERAYPGVGDWLSVACFPVGAVALVLLLRGLVPHFRVVMWLDTLIAALGIAALAYPLALDDLVDVAAGSWSRTVLNVGFPLGVLTLLVLMAAIGSLLRGFLSRMWLLLTAGLLTSLAGSTLYVLRSDAGEYVAGTPTDAWWSMAAVLFAAAAVVQPAGTRPELRDGPWWSTILVPCTSALAALGILAYATYATLPATATGLAVAALLVAGVRAIVTYREASLLAESRRLARTDDLTGLLNRRGFTSALAASLTSERADRGNAVLLMDLDRFKEVNDALGHAVGDDLLRMVGPRVQGCLGSQDMLGRLGGDEFAILLTGRSSPTAVAQQVTRALGEPFHLPGISLHAGASIGIALVDDHDSDASAVLRRADVAMYDAKETGCGFAVYDRTRDAHTRDRLETIEELRSAVGRGELVLHYQPKVHLGTGAVPGVEALVRWAHPRRGLLAPDTFLPLAERAGLMRELTHHVLELALAQLARWRVDGWDLGVAVNVSASNLLDAALPALVVDLLATYRIAPGLLTLEITESTIMADPVRARQVVQALHNLGVRVSVDDYGTGYSSLAYLRHLSVRELKLDRAFVLDLCQDPRAGAIVRSTVDLAHSLGLQMVAEGVEHGEAACRLTQMGCDVAQGYHYSRPVPPAELTAWLRERTASLSVPAGG
jgi:diguanylate cyclase